MASSADNRSAMANYEQVVEIHGRKTVASSLVDSSHLACPDCDTTSSCLEMALSTDSVVTCPITVRQVIKLDKLHPALEHRLKKRW